MIDRNFGPISPPDPWIIFKNVNLSWLTLGTLLKARGSEILGKINTNLRVGFSHCLQGDA
jgi:hypothetical protein